MLDPRQLEPALTEKEVILRDGFVSEYLKDFDPYKACIRLGFQTTFAVQWSHTLFNDGYVQRKLAYMTTQRQDNDEELKAKLEQRLLQIALRGSDSAGVAAVREIRAIKGWGEGDGGGGEDLAEQFRRLAQVLPS
jgi:hypothetical protein